MRFTLANPGGPVRPCAHSRAELNAGPHPGPNKGLEKAQLISTLSNHTNPGPLGGGVDDRISSKILIVIDGMQDPGGGIKPASLAAF